jgi:hypothetical protein
VGAIAQEVDECLVEEYLIAALASSKLQVVAVGTFNHKLVALKAQV